MRYPQSPEAVGLHGALSEEQVTAELVRFGGALRAARVEAGLTVQGAASRAHLDRVQLWRIESGRHDPALWSVMKVLPVVNRQVVLVERETSSNYAKAIAKDTAEGHYQAVAEQLVGICRLEFPDANAATIYQRANMDAHRFKRLMYGSYRNKGTGLGALLAVAAVLGRRVDVLPTLHTKSKSSGWHETLDDLGEKEVPPVPALPGQLALWEQ